MEPLARFSGWPAIERKSVFHALNQKAVARRYAKEQKRHYENLNLIVAHLGGGISVGAHQQGRVIDVNNALSGDGPFSAERTGGLPFLDVIELAFSGHYDQESMEKQFIGKGGLIAYLGTGDAIAIATTPGSVTETRDGAAVSALCFPIVPWSAAQDARADD